MEPLQRSHVLRQLAAAALQGYLGLFVGTGFSKAVTRGKAPNFEELLNAVAKKLDIPTLDDSPAAYARKSLPQVASAMVELISGRHEEPPSHARQRLQSAIAQETNLTPNKAERVKLANALGPLRPSWLITTNYDLLLEAVLETGESTLPSQPLVANVEHPPIYHLHGHRYYPTTIRVTEEDYVDLLGPIDYQRLKLPLLLVESTTLMIGYAFGDMNVRAAMAWSQSFKGDTARDATGAQGLVVQALYDANPQTDPYSGPNGEIVVEIDDVAEFLREIADVHGEMFAERKKVSEAIEEFLADVGNAKAVPYKPAIRNEFLAIIGQALPYVTTSKMIDFLRRTLDPVWEQARADRGFAYYDTYLKLLIDVLHRVDHRKCNPLLLHWLADALNNVGYYVDADGKKTFGTAWAALQTWLDENVRIDETVKAELAEYAERYHKAGLQNLLAIAATSGVAEDA